MRDRSNVDVAGVPLYNRTIPDAVRQIIREVRHQPPMNRCISATGAHGIVYARKNPAFRSLLQTFYMNLPDGMPGVWVGRMKGAREMDRCYGPDFFASLMEESAGSGIRHFLCGGADGVAANLQKACLQTFGNESICGTYTPPFLPIDEFDFEEIAREIDDAGADIVWIGISTPKQEQFAARLAKHTNVHFLITVGAAFDFHTGTIQQAPVWMQRAGLEWLFRLTAEPGRLWRRYAEIVPMFLWYATGDLFRYRFRKRSG